jgi:hypothetical protein
MSEKFLEPKPFNGNPQEAEKWIEKLESWLSFKNLANIPAETSTEDERVENSSGSSKEKSTAYPGVDTPRTSKGMV